MNIINIRKTERFVELTPTKGYKITTWNDGDNIIDFTYSTCVVIPIGVDYSNFHTITDEKVEMIEKQIEEELKNNYNN